MESAIVFGMVVPIVGFVELAFICICSSYVYWVEIKQVNCCGWCCSRRTGEGNRKDRGIGNEDGDSGDVGRHHTKKPHEARAGKLQKKSVLMLSLCSFFASLALFGVIVLHSIGYFNVQNMDPIWCEKVLPKFYSVAYVFSNVCLFQFFNARSELVKTAADSNKNFQRLRFLTILIANCAPLCAILNILMWGGTIIDYNGSKHCIDTPSWEVCAVFLFISINVSTIYLILFLWPLLAHYRQMEEIQSDSSRAILRVVKKNFVLSVTAVTFTILSMIFFVITAIVFKGQPHVNIYAISLGAVDLCMNNLCISLMSTAWIPQGLKKYLITHSDYKDKSVSGAVSPANTEEKASTNNRNTANNSFLAVNTHIVPTDGQSDHVDMVDLEENKNNLNSN